MLACFILWSHTIIFFLKLLGKTKFYFYQWITTLQNPLSVSKKVSQSVCKSPNLVTITLPKWLNGLS